MADAAITKIEAAYKALLESVPALSGHTILTDQSRDIAVDLNETAKSVLIYTTGYDQSPSDEMWQTIHTATVEFEVVEPVAQIGTTSHSAHATIAHIAGAVIGDRTLGGRLFDTEELDVSPSYGEGKDTASTTLRVRTTFSTSRTDWFTILGQAGATF